MSSSKEIRRRIKSVKSIGQITKAMELVSAAKMRKAQTQALASRPYAKLSSALLQELSGKVDSSNYPILRQIFTQQKVASLRFLIILISPNRGLAGALNSNLLNKTLEVIKLAGDWETEFITIGKKGEDLVRRMNMKIIADFESKERGISILDAQPIAQVAIEEYLAGHYSKVFIVYTDFVSTLVQRPNILQLLPLSKTTDQAATAFTPESEYLFEPSEVEVLENLVYKTLDFAVYQTLVEAQAAEHSARMVAMRNANEASSELIDDLQLSYNQARQAGITRELSEISAAKLAMEG